MNTSMLLYLMTGNVLFLLMGNGMNSNTMLMLYLMGFLNQTPSTSNGAVTTGAAGTAGALTGSMLPLLLMTGRKRRYYRRRRYNGGGSAYTRGLINGMAKVVH